MKLSQFNYTVFFLLIFAVFLTIFLVNRWWIRLNQPTVLCPGCNVIIVDIDTFRADAFDCKGKPGDSGYPPNLCEFVKDAFKFENNFAQSHWTLPSMISTHTGLYPPEHGVERYFGEDILSSNISTAPEILKNNGYSTLRAGPMWKTISISRETQTDRGYDFFYTNSEFAVWNLLINRDILENYARSYYSFFYIDSLHSPYLLNSDNPVIASISRDPFFPITKAEIDELIEKYLSSFPDFIKDNIKFSDLSDEIRSQFVRSVYMTAIEKDISVAENIHRVYDANIKEFDNMIGVFLRNLEDLKEKGNTVIVFMSDHGEAFYEHGYLEHRTSPGSQYNELIHVPLYIYVPGNSRKVISQISSNIDIFPTIFEIIGLDDSGTNNKTRGESLVPLMIGRFSWRSIFDRFAVSFSGPLVSIQNNKSKMILNILDEGITEIYNLTKDPKEKNNISLKPRGKQFKKYLMGKIESIFGFTLTGMGVDWRDRFREAFN